MKTLKEAAKECSSNLQAQAGFILGGMYVQQWIPVDILPDLEKPIIAKLSTGKLIISSLHKSRSSKRNKWMGGSKMDKITHWRYVNLEMRQL